MRVAHVIGGLDPASGGPTTVVAETSSAQARAGLKVEIWTTASHGAAPSGVEVHERGSGGGMGRVFLRAFADRLHAVDVIHLHELWSPYSARFAFAARRAGTPTVHTMHGMLMRWPMAHKSLKKRLYLSAVGRRQLSATSAVHFLNRNETRESAAAGIQCRVIEAPNGIDLSTFRTDAHVGAYRRAHPELAERLLVVSLGRLHEVKGPELALGAFLSTAEAHPDAVFVMAGPDGGMRGRLESMKAAHPAGDRVVLPGLVTGDERLALLADADIFIHASRHETASMAILEAAYARCAMVLTRNSNAPEMAEAGAAIETAANAASLGEALQSLLSARETLSARGDAARRMVEERFALSRVIPSLTGWYERLSAGERPPAIDQLLAD